MTMAPRYENSRDRDTGGNPMQDNSTLPSVSFLRDRFHYDPDTGYLHYRHVVCNAAAGSRAGTNKTKGYRHVRINNHYYLEHRIIWLIVTGEWPGSIDHRNGISVDNRWSNLRPATYSQNAQNSRTRRALPKGVYKNGRRFGARIGLNGQSTHLGMFNTVAEAAAAYDAAALAAFGEFARPNTPTNGVSDE